MPLQTTLTAGKAVRPKRHGQATGSTRQYSRQDAIKAVALTVIGVPLRRKHCPWPRRCYVVRNEKEGRPPKIDESGREILREIVTAEPHATLDEVTAEFMRRTELTVNAATRCC